MACTTRKPTNTAPAFINYRAALVDNYGEENAEAYALG